MVPRATRSLSRPALVMGASSFAAFAASGVARAEISTVQKAGLEITLYQYEVCPFCNKVRAYLDFHNIPYRVVEVDPLRKTELKQFSEDYRKVPIAVINGEQVNGSGAVIDHVHTLLNGGEAEMMDEERTWIKWVDDYLIHLLAPNIYRSPSESLQTFEYIADNAKFSMWQRSSITYSGAAAMYLIGRRLKKKYKIDDEREAIFEAMERWMAAVEKSGGKFLSGKDEPGVADLTVYGVLKAIQKFDTFADIRANNASLAEWFDRTKVAVGEDAVTVRE